MFDEFEGVENINHRRTRRVGFELPVRCKHGLTRSTVMLKDMTTHGARIEGIPRQRIGDTVILFLPELAPKLAFVVWSKDKTSGLEFELPLHENVFANLVADFAIGHLQRLEMGRPEADAEVRAKPEVPPARHAA
ncbi:PilZ domain-containing protein [Novosphingobium sp.]|uniref:PilZ domain-containing protein n=1 Tax=Novosphingobium sp. TaxID=1874826 RepID=UPI001E19BFCA|nr:PilZ domain-containing protein [Novosphingobium sp.]MBX9663849.1 PilZ domain-containing protein [Novosphingobium sp.]